MTQHNLTQILKVIRDLVMRNRPCYRDYLGSETTTKTVQIGAGTWEDNKRDCEFETPVADSSFKGFVLGETYTVILDGVSADYVAREIPIISEAVGVVIGTVTALDEENNTYDGWLVGYNPTNNICFGMTLDMSFAGKTISISQTKTETVKRYKTKLLPEYLLPAFLRKNVVASKSEVQSAAAKATAAADAAANAAADAADAAADAADAHNLASAARQQAVLATEHANAAQNTADKALPKTGGELSGAISVTSGPDTAKLYASTFDMTYIPTGGTQVSDRVYIEYDRITLGSTALSTPGISLNRNKGSSTPASIRISHSTGTVQINSDGAVSSSKRLVLSCQNELEIQSVGATPTATGLVLHSSTTGSNKRFRITVDDTGTLTATEVTS